MFEVNNFESIKIGIASPEKILEWSSGEVTKPETINYRSQKPEPGGLFCQKIFGPVKDWECACGKYRRIRNKGIVCDKCGVRVEPSKVRRERMGHIDLAAPVAHLWYLKGTPSRIATILDMAPKEVEHVVYYASYAVTDPGTTELHYKEVLDENKYREAIEKYGFGSFKVGMGAEVIKKIRNIGIKTPIVIISGNVPVNQKVNCFNLGADDYIVRPCDRNELIARIQAIVRRAKGYAHAAIQIGQMTVNLDTKIITIGDKNLKLTKKEYALLELLALRQNTTVSKEQLLNHLYGAMDEPDMKIIDVFLFRIRNKIDKISNGKTYIQTVWGRGYILKDSD